MMTKLEAKLVELGYEQLNYKNDDYLTYRKFTKFQCTIAIGLSNDRSRIHKSYINDKIISQHDIDNLQLAFNQMQKDLKELKQCQN